MQVVNIISPPDQYIRIFMAKINNFKTFGSEKWIHSMRNDKDSQSEFTRGLVFGSIMVHSTDWKPNSTFQIQSEIKIWYVISIKSDKCNNSSLIKWGHEDWTVNFLGLLTNVIIDFDKYFQFLNLMLAFIFFSYEQIDLKHINQTKQNGANNKVELGIDLREFYPSVEWDILGVPAEMHVKYYPCCVEPYPGNV